MLHDEEIWFSDQSAGMVWKKCGFKSTEFKFYMVFVKYLFKKSEYYKYIITKLIHIYLYRCCLERIQLCQGLLLAYHLCPDKSAYTK